MMVKGKALAVVVLLGIFVACALPWLLLGLAFGARGDALYLWLLGLFPTIFVVPYLLAAFRKPKPRILFLRRFHVEQWPRFPVSRVMSRLGTLGYEVVTLADTVVTDDRDTKEPVATMIATLGAFAILFSPLVLMIVASTALALRYLHLLGPWVTVVIFAPFLVFAISLWVGKSGKSLFQRALESLVGRIRQPLMRILSVGRIDMRKGDFATVARLGARRLRRRWQLGLTVIASSDQNWQAAVQMLIRTSQVICIDLAEPSRHLLTEIAELAANQRGKDTIWMYHPGMDVPFVSHDADNYSVAGQRFSGPFLEYQYPATASISMYDSLFDKPGLLEEIVAHSERLRALFPTTMPRSAHRPSAGLGRL
jgi:hypothetical protein